MKQKKWDAAYWILAVLPLAAALPIYFLIPATVQLSPEIHVPSGRAGIFVLPSLNLAFAFLFHFLLKGLEASFRRKVSETGPPPDTSRFFSLLRLYMIAFFDVMCFAGFYGYYILDPGGPEAIDLMCRAAAAMLGAGLILSARYLPGCTKRSVLALRWSYTEKNDQVWRLTHRLASRLFFATGALVILCAIAASGLRAIILAGLSCVLLFLTLYTYSRKLYEDSFKP